MSDSFVRRFLFEHLDIRGAIVRLDVMRNTVLSAPICLSRW